jgi:hypothetical protein
MKEKIKNPSIPINPVNLVYQVLVLTGKNIGQVIFVDVNLNAFKEDSLEQILVSNKIIEETYANHKILSRQLFIGEELIHEETF